MDANQAKENLTYALRKVIRNAKKFNKSIKELEDMQHLIVKYEEDISNDPTIKELLDDMDKIEISI